MHLNIKNDEAHRLAVELADLTGESLTAAVTTALRAELSRQRRRRSAPEIASQLMEIGARYAALPDADPCSVDELVGYDEAGAPA